MRELAPVVIAAQSPSYKYFNYFKGAVLSRQWFYGTDWTAGKQIKGISSLLPVGIKREL